MRVIRGLFVALTVVLVVAAIAVTVLLSPYGLHAVRADLTSWASAQLGRALHIDGELSLQVGRHLQLSAMGVRLANPVWASRPDMLLAQRVLVEVDAFSLLTRSPTLIVTEIKIDGLDLKLERTADGDENWELELQASDDTTPWLSALPYVIDQVALPGAHIQFVGPRLERPLDLRLVEVNQQRGAGDMLELTVRGQANETELNFSGQIGPFENLIAAKAFSVSAEGHLGELSLDLKARIDDLARPVDSEANLELRGPDAAYVASILGVRNLGDGPFSVGMSISPAPNSPGVRGSLVGRIGEFDIAADGELAEPSVMGRLTFRTQVTGPDVSLLAGLAGIDLLPAERFQLVATLRRTGGLLQVDEATLTLPDSALSVQGSIKRIDTFTGNDLTIHISGERVEKFRALLNIPGIATGPFDLAGTLHPSPTGEDMVEMTAKTSLVSATAAGPLGAYPDYYGTRLKFTVGGGDFAPIARGIGLRTGAVGEFEGRGQVEWTAPGAVLHASTLKVGGDTLSIDGLIARGPTVESDVQFGLQGKNLTSIADMIALSGLPAQPYKIAGRVQLLKNGLTRLDGVDITAAGAHLQFSGTLGRAPRWRGTAATFAVDGHELKPFAQLITGVALPAGPFRAQGGLTFGDSRLRLQNVSVTVAGSRTEITSDTGWPLGTPVGELPNTFAVSANGPDLKAAIPDLPEMGAVREKFDIQANGSWSRNGWLFDSLRVDTPAAFVKLQGRLDRAPDYSATALSVEAHSANLAQAGALFGIGLPAQPLQFTTKISGTPTSFRMQQLTGSFGESDFSGSVALDLTAKPDLDVRLQSDLLDLTPFTGTRTDTAREPHTVAVKTRLIPDTALPFALLERLNARVAIQSTKTHFFDGTYDGLNLVATVRDGQLTVDPLAFGSVDGSLNGRVVIGPPSGQPNVRLVANGDQIRLSVVPGMNETAAASLYKVQIDVAASGRNLRELTAALNGRIRLVGTGGRVPTSKMNALTSDFMGELLRTLNPIAKRKEFTDVVCQAYLFQISDGMLSTDPALVIRTTDIDVVSSGTVNLATEAIDFNFKTAARGGLGFSAGEFLNPYVKVSGTLSNPRLTVDAKGTLVYGGAAFATGGLSILATTLWDRVSRQKDPCTAAVEEADRRAIAKKHWW